MKTFVLTEGEYDIIMSLLEQERDIRENCSFYPGDDEDQEVSLLARIENELLWQHTHGERRPVQY